MTEARARIFIGRLDREYLPVVQNGFAWVGLASCLKPGDRVAIKPNLTFPEFRRGVMTNPEALEAVIIYFKQFTDRITICESDSGGYNRFSMDEVFQRTGIAEFARRYGVRVVNMSSSPSRPIRIDASLRTFSVPLPAFLLDETDLFVTMPVPKVHSNAVISLGLKNQWGVIQQPELRLQLHPYFKEVIYGINKALRRTISVVDGKYGLTRGGPMRGDAVDLDWVLISDNIFFADYAVSEIMGFDWRRVPHLRYAFRKEGICSLECVEFNTDHKAFIKERFYLEREWTDYPGVLTFNSRLLAYLGYESIFARPLHWLLYRFREPFY
ncbi:MAG TPA: DUF362 domain-containing protein [Candidatus Acidoferrum sp.]|nr:DUF362 domain-containing protein [Candidatus Acidoferrum sp.]